MHAIARDSRLHFAFVRDGSITIASGPLHAHCDGAHVCPVGFRQFAGRLLNVTEDVALAYGELAAQGRRMGRPLPVIDGLLLATARTHGLTLVTRNTGDTDGRGVPILSPYTGERPSK